MDADVYINYIFINMPVAFSPYTMSFMAETTIYQNEVRCRINENDFNYSQNPSTLKNGGSYIVQVAAAPAVLPSVIIGDQEWTLNNLDVTTFRNGDPIPQVTDPVEWSNLTTPAWCYYNNDPTNGAKYGKLYNWYAVMDSRGLAPQGWHIPSLQEWENLLDYVETGASTNPFNTAGGKLKSVGTTLWQPPNAGATNSSGFTGIPGGDRSGTSGNFFDLGQVGLWWSTTPTNVGSGVEALTLFRSFDGAIIQPFAKDLGLSVRCIKGYDTDYRVLGGYELTGSFDGIVRDFVTGSDFKPYATTVGLFNAMNELLVVGKLATPYPIPSNTDMTFVIRWDS